MIRGPITKYHVIHAPEECPMLQVSLIIVTLQSAAVPGSLSQIKPASTWNLESTVQLILFHKTVLKC
jgi:hypothetical protein